MDSLSSEQNVSNSQKNSPCGQPVAGPGSFIAAQERVETAYDALCAIEEDLRRNVSRQMQRRHCGSNALLQSLNQECVQFCLRQRMAQSAEWQAAWQDFQEAVAASEAATAALRGEIVITPDGAINA